MDSHVSKKPVLDVDSLEKEVHSKAEDYLHILSDDNLKSFIQSTRLIAKAVLERYYFAVEDLFLDGDKRIEDATLFEKFSDFHDGYRAKMKEWEIKNKIQRRVNTEELSVPAPRLVNEKRRRIPIIFVVIGTLIAFVLVFFTRIWIPLLVELIVLVVALSYYFVIKKRDETEYLCRFNQYQKQLEAKKEGWINSLINDLKEWLNTAESYSDSLLESFGVSINE